MRQASSDTWRKTLQDRKSIRAGKPGPIELGTPSTNNKASVIRPNNLETLLAAMDPTQKRPTPIRPMGAASAATSCISAAGGTVIDMTALSDIVSQDSESITVQAGMPLRDLAAILAQDGLEIAGCLDSMTRTVGGAVSGLGSHPAIGNEGALLASQVSAMTVISPNGKLQRITSARDDLLNVFRLSYGLLGVIFDVTIKTRKSRAVTRRFKRLSLVEFAGALGQVADRSVGLKFYLMPFRNQAYIELRRYDKSESRDNAMRWKLRDWGETTVLPAVCTKLSRIVPIAGLRYSLVDGIAEASHNLLSDREVRCGSEADEQLSQSSTRLERPPLKYSTWCFPLADAAMIIPAYRAFCQDYYRHHKYRCDMPAVGFRLPTDRSALLSPAFSEPMFALRAVSNPHASWEDFALDYANFATQWGGVPMFNQSLHVDMAYAQMAYGSRLEFFRKIRRQLDPNNRMLNPFLAQFFC